MGWDNGTEARQAQSVQPGLKGISGGKVCPRMEETQGASVQTPLQKAHSKCRRGADEVGCVIVAEAC